MKIKKDSKESIRVSLKNYWYCIRVSICILFVVLGVAIGFCVVGCNKNAFMFRTSLSLFISCGIYLFFIFILLIRILIQVKKISQTEYQFQLLENGQLQIGYNDVNFIVDQTNIKWVRQDKIRIYFTSLLKNKKLLSVCLNKEHTEKPLIEFILSCKKPKEFTPPMSFVIIFVGLLFLSMIPSFISTYQKINTDNPVLYEAAMEKSPNQMLLKLYPGKNNLYHPISSNYQYSRVVYPVFSYNPPTVAVITFVYEQQDYQDIKGIMLENISYGEWKMEYEGTIFAIHPNFDQQNTFGFIGYNDTEKRIILLGYEEGYVAYSTKIENDFADFVNQVFGEKYPRSKA